MYIYNIHNIYNKYSIYIHIYIYIYVCIYVCLYMYLASAIKNMYALQMKPHCTIYVLKRVHGESPGYRDWILV